MSDNQQSRLERIGDIIHEMNSWADDKIASGIPAGEKELEVLRRIRGLIHQLKQELNELQAENNS